MQNNLYLHNLLSDDYQRHINLTEQRSIQIDESVDCDPQKDKVSSESHKKTVYSVHSHTGEYADK